MKWTEYEDSVYIECQRIFGDQVEKNKHIIGKYSGEKRQIDVYVPEVMIEDTAGPMIVDAKYYNRKVDVKGVDSMIGMLHDVNARYGLLVSAKGFSSTAIKRAHNSPDGLQVDILSVDELQILQSPGAIIYSDSYGFYIQSPFGWIIDGTRREGALAFLYRRGFSSLEESSKEKESMYINIYPKDEFITNINDLLKYQEDCTLSYLESPQITIEQDEEITIRYVSTPSYCNQEITGFKEFDNCILFGVLFCPDIMIKRDIEKLKFILRSAIPMNVRKCDEET